MIREPGDREPGDPCVRPIGINRSHRFRIPEGEGCWADEQNWNVVAVGWPFLVTPFTSFRASSERSEGSVSTGLEMLRCAQHDRVVLLPRHCQLRAFRLLSPLLAIPATPHHPRPYSICWAFLRLMPIGRPLRSLGKGGAHMIQLKSCVPHQGARRGGNHCCD